MPLSLATLATAATVIAAKAYVDRLKEFDELIGDGSSYLLKPTGT
jgi:hypothetical protein